MLFLNRMVTRTVEFAPQEFYHVYNRGTDKRIIFESPEDYQRFLSLLYLANSTKSVSIKDIKKTHKNIYEFERGENLVAVGAYCLMPNHFHLLLTPLAEQGISKFMSKLMTGYSMYFNKKYERTGGLFESRFKAKHSDSDEYLKYLFSYIHLNPVKLFKSNESDDTYFDMTKKIYNDVCLYPYSSLMAYINHEYLSSRILNQEHFPRYFSTATDVKSELLDWISFGTEFPRSDLGNSR